MSLRPPRDDRGGFKTTFQNQDLPESGPSSVPVPPDTLTISDSLLSRQASTLEQAGYIAIRKGHVGKWPRTWLKFTSEGRTAFSEHLATLRAIVETPTGAST